MEVEGVAEEEEEEEEEEVVVVAIMGESEGFCYQWRFPQQKFRIMVKSHIIVSVANVV